MVAAPAWAGSPNRAVAYLVGGAYLAAGIIGGAVALGAAVAPGRGDDSAGLGAGWVIAYILLGVGLVVAAARGRAPHANSIAGAAYLVASVPLVAAGICDGMFSLDAADGFLHLCSAALLLGFGRTQN